MAWDGAVQIHQCSFNYNSAQWHNLGNSITQHTLFLQCDRPFITVVCSKCNLKKTHSLGAHGRERESERGVYTCSFAWNQTNNGRGTFAAAHCVCINAHINTHADANRPTTPLMHIKSAFFISLTDCDLQFAYQDVEETKRGAQILYINISLTKM